MKNVLSRMLWSALLLTTTHAFAQDFNLQFRASMEFPGQTLANICGYAQNGREYALVGGSKGLIVVEVTNPDNPVKIKQIPGPNSLWKEIKTYDHYAYVTTEGGQGIQIVDLSMLPDSNVTYKHYTGDGAIAGQLNSIHALHIDTKKGFLYAYGCGTPTGSQLFNGGAVVFDLNTDPYNPVYVGNFTALNYVHDGYAENDTLYACHINTGLLSITDMSDKSNPQLLGTVHTPGNFTHNSWLLSNHNYILTTDEKKNAPSFVTSYDISDPQDIKELDRCSPNNGLGSIGHNTHVLNDWAITSWYTDGVVITDAHRPDNLVITGWYDTWPGSGQSFDGCWGVYPFLPSGTVVASNIPSDNGGNGKLFVMTPTYVRACYLEGVVKNSCNDQPLMDASIEVNSSNPWINTTSRFDGVFKTGQIEPGDFKVTISKAGYISQTIDISLATALVTELEVTLEPLSTFDVSGAVTDKNSNTPLENATIVLEGPNETIILYTDANGLYERPCLNPGNYKITATTWGYLPESSTFSGADVQTFQLTPGYFDDFISDLNWTSQATATAGLWERADPVGTQFAGNFSNPAADSPLDDNNLCYVTGNNGIDAGADDVDNGSVTLTSPKMDLSDYTDAVVSFQYWFFNSGGAGTPPNDNFEVRAVSNGMSATIFSETQSQSTWRPSGDIHLKDYFATLSDDVRIQFIATDADPGHLVEAGVDVFRVEPMGFVSGTSSPYDPAASIFVSPNPSHSSFTLQYEWPGTSGAVLEVRNMLGQLVYSKALNAEKGLETCGDNWTPGVYIAQLRSPERQGAPVRMVKQ
ncbi:MAG: choice-of-anchor B family protein [Saprospiraceae bacterium]